MLFSIKYLIRSFHCTPVNSINDLKAQSRMLKKLINKGVRKRNNYIKSSNSLYNDILPKGPSNRKMAALNKIYFEHIIEVMQTGKCSNLLLEIGLEISKVEILENFKHLNIYWIAKNDVEYNEKIKGILKFAAGEIQYEINSQRYIGKSPEIRFVRDTNFEKIFEVENLMEIADFGKNHQLKKNGCKETQPKEEEEMRQDVLGLNHLRIKNDILKRIKREKCIALPIKDTPRNEFDDSRKLVTFDKKIFEKFYNRSRIDYLKIMKKLKRVNYADEFSQKDDEADSNTDFDDFDDSYEKEDWDDDDDDDDDDFETDDQYFDRDEHYEEINEESDNNKSSCVKNSESINTS